MKTLSPSIMRLEKPVEVCAKVLNSLGCKSVHVDVSLDAQLPGFYEKEILASGKLGLFDCPATIHIFPGSMTFKRINLGSIRENDRAMLHVYPHTGHNQISALLEDATQKRYEPAIALDIESDISTITPFIDGLKAVYIMGILVATRGLQPDKLTKSRMKMLRKTIQLKNPSCIIGIDGGINNETFTNLAILADEIVIGGLLFNAPNIYSQWSALNSWLEKIDGGTV